MIGSAKLKKKRATAKPHDHLRGRATTSPASSEQCDMPSRARSPGSERERTRGRKEVKKKTHSTESISSRSDLTTRSRHYRSSNLWSWRRHLPQSADDRTVVEKARQVFVSAEQYVNNYYQNTAMQKMKPSEILSSLKLPYLPHGLQLADALYRFSNPKAIIKHCIVQALVLMISFDARGPFGSLLPAEFTAMARALGKAPLDTDVPDSQAAFSAYRVLSSYLRRDVLSREDDFDNTRQQVISDTLVIFEAFEPWLDGKKSKERRTTSWINLMDKTCELGVFLYSQSSTFLFQWGVESAVEDTVRIAIWPRLLKIYDEDAQDLVSSQGAQHMLSLKSEDAWDISERLRSPPREKDQPVQREYREATTRVAPNAREDVIRRKSVAKRTENASELDGREIVEQTFTSKMEAPHLGRCSARSDLPDVPQHAVELETHAVEYSNINLSKKAPWMSAPVFISSRWRDSDMGSREALNQRPENITNIPAADGFKHPWHHRPSTRQDPPTSYPNNGPSSITPDEKRIYNGAGPEVPSRKSSTVSPRRSSFSGDLRNSQLPATPRPTHDPDIDSGIDLTNAADISLPKSLSSDALSSDLKLDQAALQSHSRYFQEAVMDRNPKSTSEPPSQRGTAETPHNAKFQSDVSGIQYESQTFRGATRKEKEQSLLKKSLEWSRKTMKRVDGKSI